MKINLDWSSHESVGRLIGLIGLSASHFGLPVSDKKLIRSKNTENLTNLNYLYKKTIKHQEEKVKFTFLPEKYEKIMWRHLYIQFRQTKPQVVLFGSNRDFQYFGSE